MINLLKVFLLVWLIASMPASAEQKYERSVNRTGMVTKSYENVPITRVGHMLLPDRWQMSFIDDDQRNYVVSWSSMLNGKSQYWHDALGQVGRDLQLVFLVDGGRKHVYATYPGYGREPGAQIINSTSVVFQEDKVTQEIIRRAEVNEMNYQRRMMQEKIGEMNGQRSELAEQLTRLNEQRATVEDRIKRLSKSTAEAISGVEMTQKDSQVLEQAAEIEKKQQELMIGADKADFIFFVKNGLVLTDNAKRFAKDLGYDLLVIDKKVPPNCDWYQEAEYTISSADGRQAFAEYVAPYGFKTNFTGSMVELTYFGMADNFRGCAR